MPKTKLNFRNLSVSAKIAKAKQIVAALTGSPDFSNPNPPLADITVIITKTQTKSSERDAAQQLAKAKTTELNNCEDEIDGAISQIGGYVDNVAGGDEAKILSTRFDTRATPTAASQPPPPPDALDTTISGFDGELDASPGHSCKSKELHDRDQRRSANTDELETCRRFHQIKIQDQRTAKRQTVLDPRCGSELRRSKRLERSGHEDCTVARDRRLLFALSGGGIPPPPLPTDINKRVPQMEIIGVLLGYCRAADRFYSRARD